MLVLTVTVSYYYYNASYNVTLSVPATTTSRKLPVVFVFPAMQGEAMTLTQEMVGEEAIIVRFSEPKTTFPTFAASILKAESQIENELSKLQKQYTIDTTKLICCGFSLGGDVSFAVALRRVIPITHTLVLGSRCTYRVRSLKPSVATERFVFLIGEKDERVKHHNEAISFVRNHGCRVNCFVVPDIAHSVPSKEFTSTAFDSLLQH